MTNQSPESVIAEALRRTKMSLSEPLWSEVRAEQAGHIEAALRAANMLRESGVPDAATAAIERVRAVVKQWSPAESYGRDEVLAALEGAPEPEWEYEVRNEVHRFRSDLTPDFEQANRWAQEDPHDFIVRRRKAGPWVPVESEGNDD